MNLPKPTSARDKLEQALSFIRDPSGEGARTLLTLYEEPARAAAEASDQRRRDDLLLGPLDGSIVSIKDLFDVSGEPTRAGSPLLETSSPARSDAPAVQRLKKAGAIVVGKTNMSEFAFTGVGANPHYGTPANPADRTRVPGGSSSGAAVAVGDCMCEISIGSDTGGSTRIPAALCGLVGYKPTKHRVPTDGVFPLSPTLDSIGPIAKNVLACANADAILAGERPTGLGGVAVGDLRFAIPQGLPFDDITSNVAAQFETSVSAIGKAGATLSDFEFPLLEEMERVNGRASIATLEAFRIHHERLRENGPAIDPEVRVRIEMGRAVSNDEFGRMMNERAGLMRGLDSQFSQFDVLLIPTTPITAPSFQEISSPEAFKKANRLLLRNTGIANFFDLCAISLPLPRTTGLPVGLMLLARNGNDRKLFNIAASVECLLAT